MKLRIRGNSLRVRLTQSEVAALGDGRAISETTEFSSTSSLTCRIEPIESLQSAAASFTADCIRISLPKAQASLWATTTAVSIEAVQPITRDRVLTILVEKDFECIHSGNEEDADAFPNPRLA
jgi:hypothetical protein